MTDVLVTEIGFVPVEKLPMLEAGPDQLHDRLTRLLTHEIPAFVIRGAQDNIRPLDTTRASEIHESHVAWIVAGVSTLHPSKAIKAIQLSLQAKNTSIGIFHSDMTREASAFKDTTIEAHTTLVGAGNVFVAAPGSRPELILREELKYRPDWSMPDKPGQPHRLLREGLVDPNLTDRRLFHAYVRPGDTIVHAGNSKHATWHRFDTDTDYSVEREAMLTAIFESATGLSVENIKRRWLRPTKHKIVHYQIGLDLESNTRTPAKEQ